jgi:hypothetical protein
MSKERAHHPAQHFRPRGGVCRPAAQPGLHHHRRAGECGDQAIARQEPLR